MTGRRIANPALRSRPRAIGQGWASRRCQGGASLISGNGEDRVAARRGGNVLAKRVVLCDQVHLNPARAGRGRSARRHQGIARFKNFWR
jgi:hypothetical protein